MSYRNSKHSLLYSTLSNSTSIYKVYNEPLQLATVNITRYNCAARYTVYIPFNVTVMAQCVNYSDFVFFSTGTLDLTLWARRTWPLVATGLLIIYIFYGSLSYGWLHSRSLFLLFITVLCLTVFRRYITTKLRRWSWLCLPFLSRLRKRTLVYIVSFKNYFILPILFTLSLVSSGWKVESFGKPMFSFAYFLSTVYCE